MATKPEFQRISPLSPMQEGMLFHYLLNKDQPQATDYFEQTTFTIRGRIDLDLFEKGLALLVKRHEVFRTNFVYQKMKTPRQVVFKEQKSELFRRDISGFSEAQKIVFLKEFQQQDRERGFDVTKDPLIRISILITEPEAYRLIWSFHHILMDGWCIGIIIKDFFRIYLALKTNSPLELEPAPSLKSYLDWLELQDKNRAMDYWKNYLNDYQIQVGIPYRNPVVVGDHPREEFRFSFDEETTKTLSDWAVNNQVTLNAMIQSIWGILLQKYNRVNDVVFGSVVSGRSPEVPGIAKMVGLFINTIPIRITTGGRETFAELVKNVHQAGLNAEKYSYFQLAEIQSQTQLKNDLFDHIMAFENYPIADELSRADSINELGFTVTGAEVFEQVNYDFAIIISPQSQLLILFKFNPRVYSREQIAFIGGHFTEAVRQITQNPNLRIPEIDILTGPEKRQLLDGFNPAWSDFPLDKSMMDLFEEQAGRTPDHIAVVFQEQRLTYRELNAKANQLAQVLRQKGVKPDHIVGIMVNRSSEMVIGALGVLKAGGAYLPLDPDYPSERIKYMIDDSQTSILLTQRQFATESWPVEQLYLDEASFQGEDFNVTTVNSARDLAYIIYTSGTTGKPKGAMIEHRNVVRLLFHNSNRFDFHAADTWTMFHSFCFDFSVWEMYGALLYGGKLIIISKQTARDPKEYLKLLVREQVTVLNQTPSMFYNIAAEAVKDPAPALGLRYVIFGGEALQPAMLTKWRQKYPAVKLINMYGITETTVHVTYKEITGVEIDSNISNIGAPIPDLTGYIMDPYLKLAPPGIPGELCVGGAGVGRGYLNRPELTAEKFISNPYESAPLQSSPDKQPESGGLFHPSDGAPQGTPLQSKLYRSGDLVRLLPCGDLEYLGRIDQQVKIRGHRIELGEIEARLLTHEAVKEAVVLAGEDQTGGTSLRAYFVSEQELTVQDLRAFLARSLPEYMIPSYFIKLLQVPLTPNGKVDRRALVDRKALVDRRALVDRGVLADSGKGPESEGNLGAGVPYVPPGNEIEEKLVQIWSDLLGIARIGIHDNFFELGGHSLKATSLVGRIAKDLNVELPLREVFKTPTIQGLAQYIHRIETNIYQSIQPAPEQAVYPASAAQKRIYITTKLAEAGTGYNMPQALVIDGELNRERFETVFGELIGRHQVLRTSFAIIEGELVQQVHPQVEFAVSYRETVESELDPIIKTFIQPFDLKSAPLLRVGLIKLGPTKHLLLLDMHHIIADGVSMGILTREFTRLYQGQSLPELRIQYKDFAVWQKRLFETEAIKKQENYWLNTFAGEPPVLNLPSDYSRPLARSFEGARVRSNIGPELAGKLNQLALEKAATLYMILLAAYNVILAKYTGQADLIVGTPIAGRPHPDLENIVGMFVNTLVIRNYPSGDKKFSRFLEEVKENALKAYENQDYQFEELIDKLDLPRDLSRNPLFDTMFVLQNQNLEKLDIPGLQITPFPFENPIAKFDLTLEAVESEAGISLELNYGAKLFKPETMERFMKRFIQVIQQVVDDPELRLLEIEILSGPEKQQILSEFNHTRTEYPPEKTIQDLFEEQTARTPNNMAVIFEGQRLPYQELNRKANRLAKTLQHQEVKPGKVTAIISEPSLEMIIGILGILKAGAAYLPVDPKLPVERIKYMLENSEASLVLAPKDFGGLSRWNIPVMELWDPETDSNDDFNPAPVNQMNDLAYIIYTSGTTGNPKGVMIEHGSIANTLQWRRDEYQLDGRDHVLQLCSFSFDGFIASFFTPIISGAKAILMNESHAKDPGFIRSIIVSEQITHFACVPSLYREILEFLTPREAETLRIITLAGESASLDLIAKSKALNPALEIVNEYGPTENSVITTIQRDLQPSGPVTIGKPIANTAVFILDQNHRLQPTGVAGELCITGNGLARGYIKNPELTAAKFILNPYRPGERMYLSGDLARWTLGGEIEFLGRIDNQVKIRGFRIESGEIEAQLLKHEAIREAVAAVKNDVRGNQSLCAYLVAARELPVPELRAFLTQSLPEYMIPSYFMYLEKLPFTASGKVDRNRLPEPEGNIHTGAEYIEPQTKLEIAISKIWAETLNLERVGMGDNFFDLGGNSLKAMSLVSRLNKAFNVEAPLAAIFENPTPRGITEYIGQADPKAYEAIQPVAEKEYYPVSSAQRRMFILNQLENIGVSYNMSGVVVLEGELNRERFDRAFTELVSRHESLRTSFELFNGEPVQRIHPTVDFQIHYLETAETEVAKALKTFIRPFDLQKAPLLRVQLIKIAGAKYVLMYDLSHIISDGLSMEILFREFIDLYEGKELPGLRIQYKDYAVWQRKLLESAAIRKQEEYWRNRFSGELPVLNLPLDFPRPAVQSFVGDRLEFEIGPELTAKAGQLAAGNDGTVYMVLLAVYHILLSKYTGQEDIIIGSPIAGRSHPDLEPLIGVFINTLAMRNQPAGGKTFQHFLGEVRENSLDAYENQDYQFEELVGKLNLQRDMSRNPLFDVMCILRNNNRFRGGSSSLKFSPYPFANKSVQVDLTLYISETEARLFNAFEYCVKLFAKDTIGRFAVSFVHILETVLEHPEIKIRDIEVLTPTQKRKILDEFNQTKVQYAFDQLIQELFEEQAAKTPDQIALQFRDRAVTYRELNQQANSLAGILRGKGIKPDQPVGIMAPRSLEMIIGILAILKAGAAYLPIDPEYPKERIKYILADSQTRILLTQAELVPKASFDGEILDLFDPVNYQRKEGPLSRFNTSGDLAYIIYTSGSTGKPKGVMIAHRAVHNFIQGITRRIDFSAGKTILALTTISFDIFGLETLVALTRGLKIVIAGENEQRDPQLLSELIRAKNIKMLQLTPSRMQLFLGNRDHLSCLNLLTEIMIGGEVVPESLVTEVRKWTQAKIYNMYGPTETTIWSTVKEVTMGEGINIGTPIANTQIYILDRDHRPQPVGVAGELWIAGDGLARGYLNHPELTAEKFVGAFQLQVESCKLHVENQKQLQVESCMLHVENQQPSTFNLQPSTGFSPSTFNLQPSTGFYRTGDLARWLTDGNIEFLGRIDRQVKIRGYRIELGEIEAQLLKYEAVKEAAVVASVAGSAIGDGGAREDGTGHKYLCAYLVGEREFVAQELRVFLAETLPEYMIPSYFVRLDRLPLTPNGKIDLKALPEPEGGIHTGAEYVAPETDLEITIGNAWKNILNREKIGIHDQFFDIGGNSLSLLRLNDLLNRALKKPIAAAILFQYPTIHSFARYFTESQAQITSPQETPSRNSEPEILCGEVKLLPAQKTFFDHEFANMNHWNQAWMFYYREGYDEAGLKMVFDKIVEHHDALRMVFRFEGERVIQYNRGMEGELYSFKVFDFTGAKDFRAMIEAEVEKAHDSIDLSNGPLLKIELFKTAEGDHLLMLIHHLIIDGHSIGILLKDTFTAYAQAVAGEAIRLPEKTDSLMVFAEKLHEYANSGELRKEVEYWRRIESIPIKPLPKDHVIGANTIKYSRDFEADLLNHEKTETLLRIAAQPGGPAIIVVLLTAFGMALKEWTGENNALVHLIIHGRDLPFEGVNISSTIGWISTSYPCLLEIVPSNDRFQQIAATQQALRNVPGKGIGYSLLQTIAPPETAAQLKLNLKPEIGFNYFGVFNSATPDEPQLVTYSPISAGPLMSQETERNYTFTMEMLVISGVLKIKNTYNQYEHDESTVRRLMDSFGRNIERIVDDYDARTHSRSDFG